MFVVAIKVDSVAESPLSKLPEFLAQLDEKATVGTRAELTKHFLNAKFFPTVAAAREGVKLVLGTIPTVDYRGRPYPQGFHIRSGLHVTFDSPQRSGEVGIYPIEIAHGVVLGKAAEMCYVEAQLTVTDAFKASKVGGVFKYTFTNTPPTAPGKVSQLELFKFEEHISDPVTC